MSERNLYRGMVDSVGMTVTDITMANSLTWLDALVFLS